MIQPLLNMYKLFENNQDKFQKYNLASNFFIDIYRGQPQDPVLYEYFSLPAIFVDYDLQGQGKGKPRLVTMTLHIVTDEMPDTSNISLQYGIGLNRFMYHYIIQELLEGKQLGNTTALKFMNENIVDADVINYHNQVYQFEAHLEGLAGTPEEIEYGTIELLRLQGKLVEDIR